MAAQEVSIRRYRPADRSAALALAPRLQVGTAPWRDPTAIRQAARCWVEESLDRSAAEDHAVLVAEADGDLVGIVTVATRRHFTGAVDGYVGELVVDASAERRGVGSALMLAAEGWARERGLAHVTLETGAANAAARAFYGALGYRDEDIRLTKPLGADRHSVSIEGSEEALRDGGWLSR